MQVRIIITLKEFFDWSTAISRHVCFIVAIFSVVCHMAAAGIGGAAGDMGVDRSILLAGGASLTAASMCPFCLIYSGEFKVIG
jgi:hypothetical protein